MHGRTPAHILKLIIKVIHTIKIYKFNKIEAMHTIKLHKFKKLDDNYAFSALRLQNAYCWIHIIELH